MLSRHRPDIQGTKEELLALKFDPALSKAMTEAYAAENGAILSKAGLPVTPGTTYLAHFAGPQGAVKVLQSDPSAPVSAVLGEAAVRANPFLQNMTVADLQGWADRKMGGAQAPQPQAPQAAPQAIPAAPTMPIFAAAPEPVERPRQAAPSASFFDTIPAEQAMPPPIFAPPRKPIDLRSLRAALARPPGGLFVRS